MNKYDEIKTLYDKSGQDYHGGYPLEEQEQDNNKNMYLGGKNLLISRYDKMVIPFGLFYKNRMNDLHEHAADKLLDDKREAECIEPDVFDRLFFAVGKIELPKKEKYNDNNKTRRK